jgi:hypothetical protein
MKIKATILFFLIISIFFLNIFNSQISSLIYSKKLSTNLQSRKHPLEMCHDIIDFKINNLKVIIIGDSHVYTGINLEKFTQEFQQLVLLCGLPSIRLKDNLYLANYLEEKYKPDYILVGLSPYQFLFTEKAYEADRIQGFNKLLEQDPYSFRFSTIKRFVQHKILPNSELEIAKNQLMFIKKKKLTFFDKYNETLENQINNELKTYNSYKLIKSEFDELFKNFCKKNNNSDTKIVFIDFPIPDYFNENFKYLKDYRNYLNEISNCFKVIKSTEIKSLSNKIYFFDRAGNFRFIDNSAKNGKFFYDISHLNYAGALKYTNFILKRLKEIK